MNRTHFLATAAPEGRSLATIFGTLGSDRIAGGNDNDVVFALAGQDTVWGGGGDDHVSGGSGVDLLYGDAGDDVLEGGLGADQLDGGHSDDRLRGDIGNDSLDGGDGTDTAWFRGALAGYQITENDDGTVTVADIRLRDGWDGVDTLDGVEKLRFADQTVELTPSAPSLDLDILVGNFGQANQILVNQGGLQGGIEGDFLLDSDTVPGGSQVTLAVALGDLDGNDSGGLTASGLPWLGSQLPIAADVDWLT